MTIQTLLPKEPNNEKLFKMRKLLGNLKAPCLVNFNPHRQLAIDDPKIKCKGRHPSKTIFDHETHPTVSTCGAEQTPSMAKCVNLTFAQG